MVFKNWLKTGIYFLVGFAFIWSLLHLIIYITLGAHTIQYLEIWPWIIFISQSFIANAIYFFLWGAILGFLDDKLKNRSMTEYKRLSILLSIFLVTISIIFIFRSVPGSGLAGLIFMAIGGRGIIAGLTLPWVITPVFILSRNIFAKKNLFRNITYIIVILVILAFFLLQGISKMQSVSFKECEPLTKPELNYLHNKTYENTLEWLAYYESEPSTSLSAKIRINSDVSETIIDAPSDYLINYFTDTCIPDSARIYIIKTLKNNINHYSQSEKDTILRELKKTVPSFKGEYLAAADDAYLALKHSISFYQNKENRIISQSTSVSQVLMNFNNLVGQPVTIGTIPICMGVNQDDSLVYLPVLPELEDSSKYLIVDIGSRGEELSINTKGLLYRFNLTLIDNIEHLQNESDCYQLLSYFSNEYDGLSYFEGYLSTTESLKLPAIDLYR